MTLVFWNQPTAGVNTAESPSTCQWPAIEGDSCGIGVLAASGAENCTRIGAAPLTPLAPEPGVTDSTSSGTAGTSLAAADARSAGEAAAAWLPGTPSATIEIPATRTMAAPLATSATARPLRRGDSGLASAVPPAAGSVASFACCLRNHPDRDTALSPPTIYFNGR